MKPTQKPKPIAPESANHFEVRPVRASDASGGWSGFVVVGDLEPPGSVAKLGMKLLLRRSEALNLAAWLAVMADPMDPDLKEFHRLVQDIRKRP